MASGERASLIIVSVGAVGGIFPTLLRLGIGLSQEQIKPGDLHFSLLLAMAIFAVCGGIVAAVWGEADLKKVFYLGIGLPSFLTVMTSSVSAPAVRAQSGPYDVPQLSLSLPSSILDSRPQITFNSEYGISTVPFGPTVRVPPGTTTFSIHSSRGDSGTVPLTSPKMTFRSKSDPWYGFKYAFGVNGAKPETLVPISP